MSVTSTKILYDRSGSTDDEGVRTYDVVIQATTDDPSDGAAIVKDSPLIPRRGSYYSLGNEADLAATLRTIDVEAVSTQLWNVALRYSSKVDSQNPNDDPDGDTDPVQRTPEIHIRYETVHIPVYDMRPEDFGFTPASNMGITASNGEPFNPPPTVEISRKIITIKRYESSVNQSQADTYNNTINNGVWAGHAAQTCKLNLLDVEELFYEGDRRWLKTYEIKHRVETWRMKLLDQGTYSKPSVDKEFFLDKNGNGPIVRLLDGFGNELTSGDPVYVKYNATPADAGFEIYTQTDFDVLDFPTDVLTDAV